MAKKKTFKKGDRVRVSPPSHRPKAWTGLLGTVVRDTDPEWVETEIKLDGERPDGFDGEFFWPTENLTLEKGEMK